MKHEDKKSQHKKQTLMYTETTQNTQKCNVYNVDKKHTVKKKRQQKHS